MRYIIVGVAALATIPNFTNPGMSDGARWVGVFILLAAIGIAKIVFRSKKN